MGWSVFADMIGNWGVDVSHGFLDFIQLRSMGYGRGWVGGGG